jgi:hypothetical protein
VVIGGSVVGYRSVVVYNGPGDVVSGANAWWGLRAYSSATIGGNAVRLRRDGENAEQNFTTLADGSLDVASIATFKWAANLFVVTLYDQTGNGFTATQATAANQPALVLNGLGSLPVIQFSSTHHVAATGYTQAVPVTIPAVVQRPSNAGLSNWLFANDGGYWLIEFHSSDNQARLIVSGVVFVPDVPATDAVWHSIQALIPPNTLTAHLNVDGASTTGTASSTINLTNASIGIGPNSFRNVGTINMTEIGIWPLSFTGGQFSAMNSNQQNYWGF